MLNETCSFTSNSPEIKTLTNDDVGMQLSQTESFLKMVSAQTHADHIETDGFQKNLND